jgi:hypothetical protein
MKTVQHLHGDTYARACYPPLYVPKPQLFSCFVTGHSCVAHLLCVRRHNNGIKAALTNRFKIIHAIILRPYKARLDPLHLRLYLSSRSGVFLKGIFKFSSQGCAYSKMKFRSSCGRPREHNPVSSWPAVSTERSLRCSRMRTSGSQTIGCACIHRVCVGGNAVVWI